jgi:hypothetical protein
MLLASARKDQKEPLPTLFWINKDASSASLSNSNRDIGREKNLFVQRQQVTKGRLPKRRVITKAKDADPDTAHVGVASSVVSSTCSEHSTTPPSLTESRDTISTYIDIQSPLTPKRNRKESQGDENIPLIRSICKAGEGVYPFQCTAAIRISKTGLGRLNRQ